MQMTFAIQERYQESFQYFSLCLEYTVYIYYTSYFEQELFINENELDINIRNLIVIKNGSQLDITAIQRLLSKGIYNSLVYKDENKVSFLL